MLKSVIVVACMLYALCHPGTANAEFSSHGVTRFDGSEIQYHLDRRDARSKQPIVLFLHGSDCNSIRRHPRIEGYLEMAPRHAVLFIEKYGLTDSLVWSDAGSRDDCPQDYLKNNTLSQRVLDAMQTIAHLRKTASWWDGRLLVVGGSAGAMVASQVAAVTPETTQLVILGFGSRYFKQDLMESIASSMASADLPEEVVKSELAKIDKNFEEMRENPSPVLFASGHSYAYWASMMNFDQYESLAQVSAPVLAVQGARDQNVSPQGARDLVKQLTQGKQTQIDFYEYPELDHGFKDQAGASQVDRVVQDVARWITQQE